MFYEVFVGRSWGGWVCFVLVWERGNLNPRMARWFNKVCKITGLPNLVCYEAFVNLDVVGVGSRSREPSLWPRV